MIFCGKAYIDARYMRYIKAAANLLSLPESSGSSVILVRKIFSRLLAENRKTAARWTTRRSPNHTRCSSAEDVASACAIERQDGEGELICILPH